MERIMTEFIDNHFDDIKSDLADLIAIPSESDDKEKVKEALRLALKQAEALGFRAYSVLDEQVGIVEMGEGPETLGILAHVFAGGAVRGVAGAVARRWAAVAAVAAVLLTVSALRAPSASAFPGALDFGGMQRTY
ncbi:MAG: hypothetical protein IKF61_05155, partial [Firmicutes bacterium]|nr:hypothetical protein [Bacillota bacterium]